MTCYAPMIGLEESSYCADILQACQEILYYLGASGEPQTVVLVRVRSTNS
jgi:hypothetical protein